MKNVISQQRSSKGQINLSAPPHSLVEMCCVMEYNVKFLLVLIKPKRVVTHTARRRRQLFTYQRFLFYICTQPWDSSLVQRLQARNVHKTKIRENQIPSIHPLYIFASGTGGSAGAHPSFPQVETKSNWFATKEHTTKYFLLISSSLIIYNLLVIYYYPLIYYLVHILDI